MKYILTVFLSIISLHSFAQSRISLSEQLWNRVQECSTKVYDEAPPKQGRKNFYELIDDSKIGYLKVAGEFPSCGCNCEMTVGAYKKQSGGFVFVDKSYWGCSSNRSITSNVSLDKLFPDKITSSAFFSKPIDAVVKHAVFYIDIDIPRKGTDTKVFLKLIPMGLKFKSDHLISYGYSQNNDSKEESHNYNLAVLGKLAETTSSPLVLEHILNDEFEKIGVADMEHIDNIKIGTIDSETEKKSLLVTYMKEAINYFELYKTIAHEYIVLGWNREKGTFYIKEKGNKPKQIEFIEFLKHAEYLFLTC